jgi:alkylation response protein AidB-like acyl-CoA dehydrogenase
MSGDPIRRLGLALDDEQVLVRDGAKSFAQGRLAAGAAKRDHEQRFPEELVGELAEMGLLAMTVPLEDGGAGTDAVARALALEAIAEVCASTAAIVATCNLATAILAEHADPDQKARWLLPCADGALGPASMALTEPTTGSDPSAVETTATRDGDHWVLDGDKSFITCGANAAIHLVFARTSPEDLGCFVVERGAPGLTVRATDAPLGLRASGTASLAFERCRVPADHVLGDAQGGRAIAAAAVEVERVGIAAQSIGIGEAALRQGVEYVKDRRAFGKRVADFENTRHVVARCRGELDAAWLLTLRAARLLDRDGPARAESSTAKLFASEACGHVVDHMLQLHGGYGYSREYAIERLYRDARVTRIHGGTSEHLRAVIADAVLGGD